jgi:hypothetical protein
MRADIGIFLIERADNRRFDSHLRMQLAGIAHDFHRNRFPRFVVMALQNLIDQPTPNR